MACSIWCILASSENVRNCEDVQKMVCLGARKTEKSIKSYHLSVGLLFGQVASLMLACSQSPRVPAILLIYTRMRLHGMRYCAAEGTCGRA